MSRRSIILLALLFLFMAACGKPQPEAEPSYASQMTERILVAISSDDARQGKYRRAPVGRYYLVLRLRSDELDAAGQIVLGNECAERVLLWPLANDLTSEGHAPDAQKRARPHQIVEPLFLYETADAEDKRLAVRL